MTSRRFLDASYALIAEEITRANPFAETPSLQSLFRKPAEEQQVERPRQAASNAQSMEILTAQLAGVQNTPVRVPQQRRQPRKGRR